MGIRRPPFPEFRATPRDVAELKAMTETIERRDVARTRSEIRDMTAGFDALHFIACAIAVETFSNVDFRESEHRSPLAMEHVVSTLLERPTPAPTGGTPNGEIDVIAERALQLGEAAVGETMFSSFNMVDDETGPLEQLAMQLQLHDAVICGPGFEDQAKAQIASFFRDPAVSAQLEARLRFAPSDALAFEEACTQIIERRANAMRLTEASELRRPTIIRKVTITARQLAREADRPEAAASAFLSAFALDFGHREKTGGLLWATSELRHRPFVHDGAGGYLCTSPLNLLWSFRPRFEIELKQTAAWERYQSDRAEALEGAAEDALCLALAPDETWRNLRYDVEGVGTGFEVDRMLLVDDVLLPVEVKAGELSANALRGRGADLRTRLSDLLGAGSRQATRLLAAKRQRRAVRFYSRDGTPVPVPFQRAARVEPIVVTLRDLAWTYGETARLRAAGIIDPSDELPWVVSIHALEVIAQLVAHPSQLTRYLRLRRALPANVNHRADELNLWMVYLLFSLDFPAKRHVHLASFTEPLATWWMFGVGSKPQMPLSDATTRELEELARRRPPGWVRRGEQLVAREQQGRRPGMLEARDVFGS